MKKRFLFIAILGAIGVVGAAAYTYQTTCGTRGQTVGPEFFENRNEFIQYMEELNEIDCGPGHGRAWGIDEPDPNPTEPSYGEG